MDMLHYIKWRGDLTFDQSPLNEIDSLIFSTLSYETFDGILSQYKHHTLKKTAEIFFSKYTLDTLKNRKSFSNRSYELLQAMASTIRYGDLILSNYVNEINEKLSLQFSAITISYKNKWKYIAFRGTDDTIIGWKEDFMMIYKDEVLSQRKAVDYLNAAKPTLLSKTLYYVGGHSKGGNLAMYASAHASDALQKRIIRIDNFDGPGFETNFWKKTSVIKTLPKITTYIPESSLFGRMFTHQEKIVVIRSNQRGLSQHSPFNWIVDVTHFIYETDASKGSDKAIQTFNEILEDYNKNQRETLVEALFSIFKNLDIHTIEDLTKINFNRVIQSLKELNDLDNKTKKVLRELLSMIWDINEI